jgi:hypothetical protein
LETWTASLTCSPSWFMTYRCLYGTCPNVFTVTASGVPHPVSPPSDMSSSSSVFLDFNLNWLLASDFPFAFGVAAGFLIGLGVVPLLGIPHGFCVDPLLGVDEAFGASGGLEALWVLVEQCSGGFNEEASSLCALPDVGVGVGSAPGSHRSCALEHLQPTIETVKSMFMTTTGMSETQIQNRCLQYEKGTQLRMKVLKLDSVRYNYEQIKLHGHIQKSGPKKRNA